MHSVKGKEIHDIDPAVVEDWATRYRGVLIDLGTGDGRFVRRLAQTCPDQAVIGVDTCRANLRANSRAAPDNALFLVADALALPGELRRLATRVTINFPWGSLLRGLLDGHDGLLSALHAGEGARTSLDVTINAGALAEVGRSLEEGGEQVVRVLKRNGFEVRPLHVMGADDLRACPTTWAKRLAFGRDSRALQIRSVLS